MKNQIRNCTLLIFFLIIWGCKKTEEQIVTPVETYITEMISIMETNSINRKTIDWISFKEKVLGKVKGVQSFNDPKFNSAISLALDLLKDSHSFYVDRNDKDVSGTISSVSCYANPLVIPNPDKEIGYVRITGTEIFTDEAGVNAFAEKLQNTIKANDSKAIKGWIVDLRSNFGGNMWPMLAGIGPILGGSTNGTIGYFIKPDGTETKWNYLDGVVNGINITQYKLINPNPKVAVLTDQATASSGEALVIAFKERPNTKSFGTPTCGLSTSNKSYKLSDGAYLFLTVSTMADRTKKKYGSSVIPDVVETDQQVYLKKAIDWLKE